MVMSYLPAYTRERESIAGEINAITYRAARHKRQPYTLQNYSEPIDRKPPPRPPAAPLFGP